jgi:hypothetical protein
MLLVAVRLSYPGTQGRRVIASAPATMRAVRPPALWATWARDVWAPGSCHFRGICLLRQLTHLPVSELPLARRWR